MKPFFVSWLEKTLVFPNPTSRSYLVSLGSNSLPTQVTMLGGSFPLGLFRVCLGPRFKARGEQHGFEGSLTVLLLIIMQRH